MDYEKLAREGCMNAGLSTSRSKEVASEVAAAILRSKELDPVIEEVTKKKKTKKDIVEINDTYKE